MFNSYKESLRDDATDKLNELILANDDLCVFFLAYIKKDEYLNKNTISLLIKAEENLKADIETSKKLIAQYLNRDFIIETFSYFDDMRKNNMIHYLGVIRTVLEMQQDENIPKALRIKIDKDVKLWIKETHSLFLDDIINAEIKKDLIVLKAYLIYIYSSSLERYIMPIIVNEKKDTAVFDYIYRYLKGITTTELSYNICLGYIKRYLNLEGIEINIENAKIIYELITEKDTNNIEVNKMVNMILENISVNEYQRRCYLYKTKKNNENVTDNMINNKETIKNIRMVTGKIMNTINFSAYAFDNFIDLYKEKDLKNLDSKLDILNNKTNLTKDEFKNYNDLKKMRQGIATELKDNFSKKTNIELKETEDGKFCCEEKKKDKKHNHDEFCKLLIPPNIDVNKISTHAQMFFEYLPNIPNFDEIFLNEEDIIIDAKDYCKFHNIKDTKETRKKLYNALKTIRHLGIEYSFYDSKEGLVEGDKGFLNKVEYRESIRGKKYISLEFHRDFKRDYYKSIQNGEYILINSDIYNVGHKVNDYDEQRAKTLIKYLAEQSRINAKNQKENFFSKEIKIITLITKLKKANLLTYNPYEYKRYVVDKLLNALNKGVERGWFTYETDAFENYDIYISTNNYGANKADEKIKEFEHSKITLTINNNMINVERNKNNHKKYTKEINRTKKKVSN